MKRPLVYLIPMIWMTLACWVGPGEGSESAYSPDTPILRQDNDDAPIPAPALDEEGDYIFWDGVNAMVFLQVEKTLDMGFVGRKLGTWMGLAGPVEAENVNVLDETPDSTWFVNRHARHRMSEEELQQGPNLTGGPDMQEGLTVISGKSIGLSPGFVVEDRKGERFMVKFDPPRFPEMATATEMVASKFMYAAGYNVPEYYIINVAPKRLAINEGAKITGKYKKKRPMTEDDLAEILGHAARSQDGTYRAIATKLIPGETKGPPPTTGRRKDDPNDTVFHQNRRELRGLRVISSFINNTDSRRGNYLDTYIGQNPQGHLVHYMLDFSASMGSGNIGHKEPKYGNEYFLDPGIVLINFATLGFWVKPWEDPGPAAYESVGFFEDEIFNPRRWRTSFPNPMFERMTNRDAFWGAKIVASFTDQDIRTIVRAGQWSNPAAQDYVVATLIARRDKISRTWFDVERINPLDWFEVSNEEGHEALVWRDLGVTAGGSDPDRTTYRYRLAEVIEEKRRKRLGTNWHVTGHRRIPLPETISDGDRRDESSVCGITLETSRDEGKSWSPRLTVYVCRDPAGGEYRVMALHRES